MANGDDHTKAGAAAGEDGGVLWFDDAVDHIRHRPETYVGALQAVPHAETALCVDDDGALRPRLLEATVSPVLLKMMDEVVVNAMDNVVRSNGSQTYIRINIDGETGAVEVANDGAALPIERFGDTGMWTPEVAFTKAFAGTNFDDDQDRQTGGRNGIGVKACFVFSKASRVEVGCTESKRLFAQTHRDNLREVDAPKITRYSLKKNLVKIWFQPDFRMLTMPETVPLPEAIVHLMQARVVEAGVCVGSRVSIFLNQKRLPLRGALDFAKKSFPGASAFAREEGDGFEVVFCVDGDAPQPRIVSFVNGCRTSKGGTHVDFFFRTLASALQDKVRRKLKKPEYALQPRTLREVLSAVVVVNTTNPRFNGQLKESLDSPFRAQWTPSAATHAHLERICVDRICALAAAKTDRDIAKDVRSVRAKHVEKYSAATRLGRKNARCTLLVTEGDSAKALAIAGMAEVGRDLFGVFPLRGKIVNVLKNSAEKVHANKEMRALTQILGLRYGHSYSADDVLPYAHVAIFSDQDTDGAHIAGLLLNFLHAFYKTLLQARPDFVKRFATPLVKVWTGSAGGARLDFFSECEYARWLASNPGAAVAKTKFYKGLGTSSDAEAREYFRRFEEHTITVRLRDQGCDDAMRLFFDPGCADGRKAFLSERYDVNSFVDYTQGEVSVGAYMFSEFSHYVAESNRRAIPSCVDGLKPAQRKVLYTVLRVAAKGVEHKVSTLAAQVAQATAYHHGDDSLKETIVLMAQRFVGRNNVALLQPLGQFGSRAARGDHAAYRYISTMASPMARAIFPAADDAVLEYLRDEGQLVEPSFFVPVIPFALLNGVEGIGSGWSTSVPNYALGDLVANARRFVRGELMQPMAPSYAGFRGEIEVVDDGAAFVCRGAMRVESRDPESGLAASVRVTELPVGGEFLDEFVKRVHDSLWAQGGGRGSGFVMSLENACTPGRVDILLRVAPESRLDDAAIFHALRLERRVSLRNLVLFDARGSLRKFGCALEVVRAHAEERLACYERRKSWQVADLSRELALRRAQLAFVRAALAREVDLFEHTDRVRTRLADLGFAEISAGFAHLLGMSVSQLTEDKASALAAGIRSSEAQLAALQRTTAADMWLDDLARLEEEAARYAAADAEDAAPAPKRKGPQTGGKAARKTAKK